MSETTIHLKTDSDGIDWEQVAEVLQKSGLSDAPAEVHKKAFQGSGLVAILLESSEWQEHLPTESVREPSIMWHCVMNTRDAGSEES